MTHFSIPTLNQGNNEENTIHNALTRQEEKEQGLKERREGSKRTKDGMKERRDGEERRNPRYKSLWESKCKVHLCHLFFSYLFFEGFSVKFPHGSWIPFATCECVSRLKFCTITIYDSFLIIFYYHLITFSHKTYLTENISAVKV